MAHYYACPCLNVKIRGSPSPSGSSVPSQDKYQRIDVDEEGIQITHSDLTLRSRAFSGQGADRARFTTLTCLLCNVLVYRVPADAIGEDLPEGPIVNRDGEWSVAETLRNKDGWVEVATTCMSDDAYHKAVASSTYSSVFSVVLPARNVTSPTTKTQPTADSLSFTIPPLTSSLPPLFLAPPFTPAHAVFHTFSKHAIKSSDELRQRVEQELEAFVTAKIHDLAAAERELKRDVDFLWRKWKEAWKLVNGGHADNPELSKRESAHQVPTIKDFVPQRPTTPPTAENTPSLEPANQNRAKNVGSTSLLSASLAASSSIHQHMRRSPDSMTSTQDTAHASSPSGSPTLATLPSPSSGGIAIGAYTRRVDESLAVAASLKIAMEDEAAMAATIAAYKEKAAQKAGRANANEDRGESSSSQDPARGRTPPSGSKRVQFAPSIQEEDEEAGYAMIDEHDAREPELFDFEPIPKPSAAMEDRSETSITPISSPRRSALRLAEATEQATTSTLTPNPAPELSPMPLPVTAPAPPVSPSKRLDPTEAKIREIMAAEAPSHRAAWKQHENSNAMFAQDLNQKGKAAVRGRGSIDDEEEWEGSDLSDKSDKRSQGVVDMARSLPINIGPLSGQLKGDPRIPKSSLADRPNVLVPPLRRGPAGSGSAHARVSSSVATRERAYMARDISRSMDPGHSLDFGDRISEEDEDGSIEGEVEEPSINILEAVAEGHEPASTESKENDREEPSSQPGGDEAERSRQRALRILKRTQDHAPDAGMWRSVAE